MQQVAPIETGSRVRGDAGSKALTVLRVDASGRRQGSYSRELAGRLLERLRRQSGAIEVIERDAAEGIPFVDTQWIEANGIEPEARTDAHRAALASSDLLVAELIQADVLVLTVPIYNFGMPAALKAWFDQVCRARLTFRYTENGPEGLLKGKKAYVVVTSGGTPVGSNIDFATGHVRFLLGFIGIEDVEVIAADRLIFDGDAKVQQAVRQIEALEVPLAEAA
ncbi:MAG: NAD(P)H-dependent oxidoreductase [Burkholderiales bacterium]|nr:MAG: NAD(P)H-dependent oxidoreductase [Burkholderiales bacterium]